jgi:hypothetical protein
MVVSKPGGRGDAESVIGNYTLAAGDLFPTGKKEFFRGGNNSTEPGVFNGKGRVLRSEKPHRAVHYE